MIVIEDKKTCSGCYACMAACPKTCIQMNADVEGFWYPNVDKKNCIDCGLCEKVCPIGKTFPFKTFSPESYAVINKDENIRMQSSSGGAFTVLAERILKQGGVVFGAAFNDDFSVAHKCVDNIEELGLLRGSKYVQSRIGTTYKEAEKFLEDGRFVLFTGTPCQVAGLITYLRKPYDNLFTQDFICHGVPSPKIWAKYLEFQKSKEQENTIETVEFRNKIQGWKKYSMHIKFVRGDYLKTLTEDPMLKAFLKNLCLRPSCYACAYKTVERISDITLADFWGIEKILPEFYDKKGVSLMIIQSKKGAELFNEIKEDILWLQVPIEQAIQGNSSMVKSAQMPIDRAKFMNEIEENGFDKAERYWTVSLWDKMITKVKEIVKRIFRRNNI